MAEKSVRPAEPEEAAAVGDLVRASYSKYVERIGREPAPMLEDYAALMRAGEVWAVDATAYFSRPGPRVVDGTEILARILHPELFGTPWRHEAVRVPAELQIAGT